MTTATSVRSHDCISVSARLEFFSRIFFYPSNDSQNAPKDRRPTMDLTPVRIRGKKGNGRPKRQRSISIASNSSSTISTLSKRSSKSAALSATGKPVKKRRRAKPLSRLEQLPTEILETIFNYAANISLPTSSIALATKLGRYVQLNFALRILYNPKHWYDLSDEGIRDMRTQIIARRFFTWDFFQELAARAAMIHENAHKRALEGERKTNEPGSWILGDGNDAIVNSNWDNDLLLIYPDQREGQQRLFWPNLALPVLATSFAGPERADDEGAAPNIPITAYIPDKLLRGPFDMEKSFFLSRLLTCNAMIDYSSSSTAGEVALQGLYSALGSSSTYPIASHLIFSLPPRLMTTELVRAVVEETQCDQSLVADLILGRISPVLCCSGTGSTASYTVQTKFRRFSEKDQEEAPFDAHDPWLWAWADREEAKGSKKGKWLKHKLRTWVGSAD